MAPSEVLERLAQHPFWTERAAWAKSGNRNGARARGTGLAVGGWLGGLQPTGATVRLNPDGSLSVLTGQVDIAGTNIALAQIAASAYGVDIDKVRITTGDTDVGAGHRAQRGQQDHLHGRRGGDGGGQGRAQQTLEIAAKELEASVHDLEIEDGQVVVRGVPDRAITLAHIGKKGNLYMSKIQPVLGVSHPAFSQQAPASPRSSRASRSTRTPASSPCTASWWSRMWGAPSIRSGVEGQMQGGAVQSLGMALTEALIFDDGGRLTNPSLLDYRKLTAADLPNIETIIVEVPSPSGPFGARGVGEPPIIPAPAAIANAIQDATGVRLTELPLTPERIALAIAAQAAAAPRA